MSLAAIIALMVAGAAVLAVIAISTTDSWVTPSLRGQGRASRRPLRRGHRSFKIRLSVRNTTQTAASAFDAVGRSL